MTDRIEVPITDGAILKADAPAWENHTRGKNWAAVIHRDPKSPGGLARAFLERGRGPYAYIAQAQAGDALEFGADYYSGSGRPSRTRIYCLLIEAGSTRWTLAQYESAAQLFAAQREWVPPAPTDKSRVITLEPEPQKEEVANAQL